MQSNQQKMMGKCECEKLKVPVGLLYCSWF